MSSSAGEAMATIVHDLFVLPDYRNNGAALKLTEAAVRFAIHNKSSFIRLEILQENLSAKKLFESVGFKCQTPAPGFNVYSIQLGRN
jgi:ribosomal protein S18 acetylase RimI-like enzyme